MRIALLLLVAACTSTVPAGSVCSSNSDCESGQTCLEFGEPNGSACGMILKLCGKTCGSNADCTSLGAGFICFPACTSAGSAMECTGAGPG